jgi:hypothetical protein
LLFAIVGVFEEIVRHGPGYTRHRDGRNSSALAKETGTAALSAYGETYEPNPSQCEPMSITMCWIGAQGFTESDRAVLLEEDVR